MPIPGGSSSKYQKVVPDIHNWPLDVLLVFYDLGSMQHITTTLPGKFERLQGHSLRPYAFMGNLGQLISHLIAGVRVGQFFSGQVCLTEVEFYQIIWPLFAECLWESFQGLTPLPCEKVIEYYRYKKAMRIISSSDLEPIKFLFRHNLPDLTAGPILRGAFNQLSTQKKWSRVALTTETVGRDQETGAIIQTQPVFGQKHISDKTREVAGRLRSVQLRYNTDGSFEPEPNPGVHYLVIDGDWPVESKINLYEAGFQGIYEIAELDSLAKELNSRKRST